MNTVGYIYVLINKFYNGLVKIGYADDVDKRLHQLNHPSNDSGSLPCFTCYAKFPVAKRCLDIQIHNLIDLINPALRCLENREFYIMQPEQAVDIISRIAAISGNLSDEAIIDTTDIEAYENVENIINNNKKAKTTLNEIGIVNGTQLVLKQDETFVVTVADDINNKVNCNGQIISLQQAITVAREADILHSHVGAWVAFTYNGEQLYRIRDRYLESKDQEAE